MTLTDWLVGVALVLFAVHVVVMIGLAVTHRGTPEEEHQVEFYYIDRSTKPHFSVKAYYEEVTPAHREAMRKAFLDYYNETRKIRGDA